MKKEERSSISISKDTRDRFMTHLAELIGERRQVLTQDEAVNVLLTVARQLCKRGEN